ncbi:MAG: hypothetical protein FD156_2050 [Nitrospirae bacterium]|nr:MAG: hypothetical protein FD156_2050 [Nitrospirota bacterium]
MEPCPICQEPIDYSFNRGLEVSSVSCLRCGNYHITREALANLKTFSVEPRQRANASGWLYDNPSSKITTHNLDQLMSTASTSFHERANKILLAMERRTEYAGEFVPYNKSWISWGWCLNEAELKEILGFLASSQRIISQPVMGRGPAYKIAADGWQKIEDIKKINADSLQAFVAMWFDATMQDIYDTAISEAILAAGYKPHRVDQREHNNKIDDEIIAQIRRSRFVVADFTGHRGGVYFEAGYGKGLGLEVFLDMQKR